MVKIDLVLQGVTSEFTNQVIQQYSQLEFVNKIILSSYKNSISVPNNIVFVENHLLNHPGITNRNHQINTTRNGLLSVTTEYCAKMRTDQLISNDCMHRLYNFWMNSNNNAVSGGYLNPKRKIYVMGMYRKHVFHPRDHVFWGHIEDLKNLFDIPFDNGPDIADYDNYLRSEAYIGQFYYARYDPAVYEYILNPREYIVDTAPKKQQALEADYRIRDQIFQVFPRVIMSWPKYGLDQYHYDVVSVSETEYWYD